MRQRSRSTFMGLALLLALALMTPRAVAAGEPPAQADVAPVVFNEAVVAYPNTVTFRLELAPDAAVTAATLVYDVRQRSCVDVSSSVPVPVDGDTLEWTWVMSRSGNPPPGVELWWEWVLTDAAGNTVTTPRQSLTLADDRFPWQTVSADGVHLYWYEGEDVGPILLDAATDGLRQLETDMGIELQEDVQLYIYGDAADMRAAVLYIQDWAGGVAFDEYSTILIGVEPYRVEEWGRDTVRHELAHLVVGQFGWSCLGGSRPTWLNEGLAVYAEGEPNETVTADIARGLEEDAFLPLRSLNGAFPTHSSDASMAYSQSYSVVAFMLAEYGDAPLQELLLALADGEGYDEALEAVYGVNVDGLEQSWRAAIGAPPRQIPPTPTAISAAAVPTFVPLDAPASRPTPPAAASAPPATTEAGGCFLGLIPLLGLVFVAVRRPRRP